MKSLIIALTVAASTLFGSAHATEGNTSAKAIASFESTFTNASEISWKSMGSISKVTFTVNGKASSAYYNTDGELIATARYVSSAELPSLLKKSLLKEMKEYWISDLFEVKTNEGTSYYVNLENADKKVVLKADNEKKWSAYQTSSK